MDCREGASTWFWTFWWIRRNLIVCILVSPSVALVTVTNKPYRRELRWFLVLWYQDRTLSISGIRFNCSNSIGLWAFLDEVCLWGDKWSWSRDGRLLCYALSLAWGTQRSTWGMHGVWEMEMKGATLLFSLFPLLRITAVQPQCKCLEALIECKFLFPLSV